MTGHLSAQRIELYHQGKLAPDELLLVGDHIAVCAACRKQMGSTDSVRRAFGSFGVDLEAAAENEPAHLPAEQMAALVDNDLDETDRTIAETHLESCDECRDELVELRRLKSRLLDSTAEEQPPRVSPALWNRMGHWSRPIYWLPLPAAAVIVLAFFLLVVIPLQKQLAGLNAQINDLQKSNEDLQERLSLLAGSDSGRNNEEDESVDNGNPIGAVVALNDGAGVVALDKQGRVTGLNSLSEAYEQMLRAALTNQRVKISPLVSDLVGKRDVLLGGAAGPDGFALKGPLGTAVENDRPTFSWSPMVGATSYFVTVYNARSKAVTVGKRITGTEWVSENALERGDIYAWEVTAVRDGQELTVPVPPTPQARFRVLDQAKMDELSRARQNHPESHLILGILYAQAGLPDEARRHFEALAAANPDSLTARKLLRSLKETHGPK